MATVRDLARRPKLRRLISFWAAPGWLISIIDAAQRVHFASWLATERPKVLQFINDWGWLIGLGWLFLVALWPTRPREEVRHAQNAERLSGELVNLLHRIERLCALYESPGFSLASHRALLEDRRQDLIKYGVADLLEYLMESVPEELRPDYRRNSIAGAIAKLYAQDQGERSAFSREVPLQSGLELYLNRHPPGS